MAYLKDSKDSQNNATCPTCQALLPKNSKTKLCENCRKIYRARSGKRRNGFSAAGLCAECGKVPPIPNRKRCEQCLAVLRTSVNRVHIYRKSAGVCHLCGGSALRTEVPTKLCETCYFKRTATQNLGDYTLWLALKAKWENQKGRCPYSGIYMVLGHNSSIDHILPVSRFPERAHDIENVEWVEKRVNKQKHNLTKTEFLAQIKLIMDYTSQSPFVHPNDM